MYHVNGTYTRDFNRKNGRRAHAFSEISLIPRGRYADVTGSINAINSIESISNRLNGNDQSPKRGWETNQSYESNWIISLAMENNCQNWIEMFNVLSKTTTTNGTNKRINRWRRNVCICDDLCNKKEHSIKNSSTCNDSDGLSVKILLLVFPASVCEGILHK